MPLPPDPRGVKSLRMLLMQRGSITTPDPNDHARQRDFAQKKKLRAMLEEREKAKNPPHLPPTRELG